MELKAISVGTIHRDPYFMTHFERIITAHAGSLKKASRMTFTKPPTIALAACCISVIIVCYAQVDNDASSDAALRHATVGVMLLYHIPYSAPLGQVILHR